MCLGLPIKGNACVLAWPKKEGSVVAAAGGEYHVEFRTAKSGEVEEGPRLASGREYGRGRKHEVFGMSLRGRRGLLHR